MATIDGSILSEELTGSSGRDTIRGFENADKIFGLDVNKDKNK